MVDKKWLNFIKSTSLEYPQIEKLYASGSWQNWFSGKDNRGNKIKNSFTWKERANAYDDNVFLIKEKDFIEARQCLIKKEAIDVEAQLKLWDEISHFFMLYINNLSNQATVDNVSFDPSKFIAKGKEIWKWRDEIASFSRRTLGMPSIIKDKDLPDDPEDEDSITVKWNEPIKENDDIGIGRDELNDAKNTE